MIPLRKNMDATVSAVILADNHNLWKTHPTRNGQWVAELSSKNAALYWKECEEIHSGVLVKWRKRDGEMHQVLFVSTIKKLGAKKILQIYDQRAEIEEAHRQLKENMGLEKLPSKKFAHVVFRILMAVVGYNLMVLFLNSENCVDFEEFSLKSLRQKKAPEPNPEVIVYTKDSFAIMRLLDLLPMLMEMVGPAKEKLIQFFKNLSLNPAPS